MLPILYQSSDLIIYSYPLLMGIGWGVAYQIYFSELSSDVSQKKAQYLFWGVFLSAWIGSKILFSLTYESENLDYLSSASFWTGGGFVFYGGLLLALFFLGINKLFDKSLTLKALWPMIPALTFGHGVGRIGCFLAGCCFGKPTDFFWGIFLHGHHRHPTQLIEAFSLIALGFYLIKSKREKSVLIAVYFSAYGLLRFFIEALRGDLVRGSWGSLTPSQWISLVLICSGVTLFFTSKNRRLS